MHRNILIGSLAAKHWFSDFREPKDADYIGAGEHQDGVEYYWTNAFQWIYKRCAGDIATPDILYTIKLSHCFWPVYWTKTMADILFFQQHGIKHNEELFELLYSDWENRHGPKRAYLAKSNDDFFKDGVKRKYVHDDIHQAIAYYERPLYQEAKSNQNRAYVDKNLFDKLSFDRQIKMCREEIYVTAIERFQIEANLRMNVEFSYLRASRLMLTSMSRGWFPKFIATNWIHLRKPDGWPFVELFQLALQDKQIRPI